MCCCPFPRGNRLRQLFLRSPSQERLHVVSAPSVSATTATPEEVQPTTGGLPTSASVPTAKSSKWAMLPAFLSNFFPQRIANSFKRGSTKFSCTESSEPETGSDARHDEKVSYGFSMLCGKRATMEDFLDAQFKRHKNGNVIGFFGVYDGHGGPGCARYVRDHLPNNVLDHPEFVADLKSAVEKSYLTTDKKYLNTSLSYKDDGCTAVSAIVVDRKLVIANVGDSRAVLCHDGQAVQLTVDHKPNLFAEKERIESQGGMVLLVGTWRVGGILAVSRAFGDRRLKKYVIAEPHTTVIEELTPAHEFLIMATDGVWDVMTNDEAVDRVRNETDSLKAACMITTLATNRGSADNISCIVIRFRFT